MSLNLKTCIYKDQQSELNNYFNKDKLAKMGFDILFYQGECQDLFAFLSANKVDLFILDATKIDKDRCVTLLQIIYKNFCKSILIITDEKYYLSDGMQALSYNNNTNFDLNLTFVLYDMKNHIESLPHKNEKNVKAKIRQMLMENCFSSKNSGFDYYVEALYIMFQNFPQKSKMMQVYDEVGKVFFKSYSAIEKGMRLCLMQATKRAKLLPNDRENQEVKTLMTYDLNNKYITNIFVRRLTDDKSLFERACEVTQNQTDNNFYQ